MSVPEITPLTAASASEEFDDFDFGQLLQTLRSGKWIVATITLLITGVGYAYVLFTPPVYETDALIQIEPSDSASFNLIGGQATPQATAPNTSAEIQILRSRKVLRQVVEQSGLDIVVQPLRFPVLGAWLARRADAAASAQGREGPAPAWLGLERYAWGGERLAVARLLVPDAWLGVRLKLVAGATDRYVLYGPGDQPILEGRVGEIASAAEPAVQMFVSELTARPNTTFVIAKNHELGAVGSLNGRLKIQEQDAGTGMLRLNLEGTDFTEIRRTLNAITTGYLRQNVERRSAEAKQRLDFVESQLPKVRRGLEEAEERYSKFREHEKVIDLDSIGQELLQQGVDLETQVATLQLKQVELANDYTPRHPSMVSIRQQLGELDKRRADLDARVSALPESQQQLLRLQREVQVAVNSYTALLNRAEEFRIARAGTVGNVRIVDEAEGGWLVRPIAGQVLTVSFVMGGLLGVVVVFLREMLRRGVTEPGVLQRRLGLATLAVVPFCPVYNRLRRRARRDARPLPVLVDAVPAGVASEGLRSLRTSLHFMLRGSTLKVIAITSPAASAGKSFVSLNLAALLAELGLRVLVIDSDLRRGTLHRYAHDDSTGRLGLADLLAGRCDFDSAVHPLEGHADAFLMRCGTRPPNPAGLLMGASFDDVIAVAESRYDLVLLDCPPVLPVTDGVVVAARAGAVLLVIRAHVNTLDEVKETYTRLRQARATVSGVVLNGLYPEKARGYYGSYNYRRYTYRYESEGG